MSLVTWNTKNSHEFFTAITLLNIIQSQPHKSHLRKDSTPMPAESINPTGNAGCCKRPTAMSGHWMVNGKPNVELPIVHADRLGNDMTQHDAIESIKACYRQGYRLPAQL